jgi:hypothetical protein
LSGKVQREIDEGSWGLSEAKAKPICMEIFSEAHDYEGKTFATLNENSFGSDP